MQTKLKQKRWRFFVGGVLVCVMILGGTAYCKRQTLAVAYADWRRPVPPKVTEVEKKSDAPALKTAEGNSEPSLLPEAKPKETALPAEFNLSVPFSTQSPFANWDAIHEETCEEASLLMVNMYVKGIKLSPDEVEKELLRMVDEEKKLFGYYEDTNVEEILTLAKKRYGFSTGKIITNPSITDLQKEILAGKPIIFPANGKLLKNPNFRHGGPPFHMLVLRGWNAKGFFTNDPGTRKGENYFYSYDTIMTALRDWSHEDESATGPKRVLVLEK